MGTKFASVHPPPLSLSSMTKNLPNDFNSIITGFRKNRRDGSVSKSIFERRKNRISKILLYRNDFVTIGSDCLSIKFWLHFLNMEHLIIEAGKILRQYGDKFPLLFD